MKKLSKAKAPSKINTISSKDICGCLQPRSEFTVCAMEPNHSGACGNIVQKFPKEQAAKFHKEYLKRDFDENKYL